MMSRVRTAPRGGHHGPVRTAAITLGGLIHTGLTDASEIRSALRQAMAGYDCGDVSGHLATVDDGIDFGRLHPMEMRDD